MVLLLRKSMVWQSWQIAWVHQIHWKMDHFRKNWCVGDHSCWALAGVQVLTALLTKVSTKNFNDSKLCVQATTHRWYSMKDDSAEVREAAFINKQILISIIIRKFKETLTYHGWDRRGRFKEWN